jgi:hypothetical protein
MESSVPTKDEALNAFYNLHNTYAFGLTAAAIFPEVLSTLNGIGGKLGDESVSFTDLAQAMKDPAKRKQTVEEFEKSLKRTVLREAHELLLWYTTETSQFTDYDKQPWSNFARAMRHILSHGQVGAITDRVKPLLPAKWRSMVIAKDQKELLISPSQVFEFLLDMETFLKYELK